MIHACTIAAERVSPSGGACLSDASLTHEVPEGLTDRTRALFYEVVCDRHYLAFHSLASFLFDFEVSTLYRIIHYSREYIN